MESSQSISGVIGVAAVLLYLGAAVKQGTWLSRGIQIGAKNKLSIIILSVLGAALHAFVVYTHIVVPAQGLNLGFFNVLSLLAWVMVVLSLLIGTTRPIENLNIIILPLASLAIGLDFLFPTEHLLFTSDVRAIEIHIVLSVLAYSLLSLAAFQAVLFALQERHLRNKHPGGFIQALPPLQTMETLLFQILTVGFIFQSLSLGSGFLYLDNMFSQHLAHKTILSVLAWMVYALLLWGRWRFGWRGRTAIRWTFSGFSALLLAYLGSKMVMEIILSQ